MLIIAVACLASCQKGEKGDTGSPGKDGTNGNANVHTQNFTINNSQWYHVGTAGQPNEGYWADISCSIITSEIVSTGAVLAYIDDGSQTWVALPATIPTGVDDTYPYSRSCNYEYSTNLITIIVQDNDFYTTNPGLNYFKVVTIAGNAKRINPKIDFRNYNEVKRTFNLAD